jgi:hypothetical protein
VIGGDGIVWLTLSADVDPDCHQEGGVPSPPAYAARQADGGRRRPPHPGGQETNPARNGGDSNIKANRNSDKSCLP